MTVPKLWPGAMVAILATGPSLTREDVEYCRGRARVIAVNDAWTLAPWADVLYSSDRQWHRYYQGVSEFTGLKFGIGSSLGTARPIQGCPDVVVLNNSGVDGLDDDSGGLRTGQNSGYAAINLAVHFGAARILLLGYNLGTVSGRAHYFGDHPRGLSQNPALYPGFRRSFETLVAPLVALKIDVFNCTPASMLTAFPMRTLRDVLPQSIEVAA